MTESVRQFFHDHPEVAQLIAEAQGFPADVLFQLHSAVSDGAFSAGSALEFLLKSGESHKVFVSQPNPTGFGLTNHIADHIQAYLEAHRSLPGTMEPLHLFVVTETGQVVDISKVQELLRVAVHLPDGAISAFQQLRQALTEKWSDTQIIERFQPITEKIVNILVQIHTQPLSSEIRAKAGVLYSEALWRVHSDKELTAGVIHRHDFTDKKWVSLPQVLQLQSLMVEFEHLTRRRAERLVPLHGDPWFRNAYTTPDGEVALIDQSRSAYGEPALDLSLAIGDSLNYSIILEENQTGPFRTVAQAGLDLYLKETADAGVLEMLPVMFAFKTFALSVNSPVIQDQARQRLFATGLGCLAQAVDALKQQQQFCFDVANLESYFAHGQRVLTSN